MDEVCRPQQVQSLAAPAEWHRSCLDASLGARGFSRRWISRSFALAQLASFGSVRCIQLHRSEHYVAHATLLGRESRLFLVACASCCVVYHAGLVLRLVLLSAA